jgi:N-acetylneuraminic acid mutarotase
MKNIVFLLFVLGFISCEKTVTDNSSWIQKVNFPGYSRSMASSFCIGDSGYFGLGYNSNSANGKYRLSDFWRYYPDEDQWKQIDSFPGLPRSSAVGIGTSTKGYIIGGFSDGGFTVSSNDTILNDVWQYDPSQPAGRHPSAQWTNVGLFPGTPRYGAIGFSIHDTCYFGTGLNYFNTEMGDFWQYIPSTNTWKQLVNLPGSKREYALAFVINNKGYVVTGLDNGVNVNDFWEFDPSQSQTKQWIQKNYIADIQTTSSFDNLYTSIVRNSAVAFVINNFGYVTTGVNGSLTNITWQYDPIHDLWNRKADFKGIGRDFAASFSFISTDRGFVLTGQNGTQFFIDNWEFKP